MLIAEKIKEDNIAAYLLYMWQEEDILRAFHLDMEKLKKNYLPRFANLPEEDRKEQEEWYGGLISMMHGERVTEHGHLQLCKNVLQNLQELHAKLDASPKYAIYHAAYLNALPIIVELRANDGAEEYGEIEICFIFLYGLIILRMQHKPVSEETAAAQKRITDFIHLLADYYKQDQKEPLEF